METMIRLPSSMSQILTSPLIGTSPFSRASPSFLPLASSVLEASSSSSAIPAPLPP